jgi:hypothetical protein
MAFRDQNSNPIYPGAYYANTGTLLTGGNCSVLLPIYGSITNFSNPYNSDNADNYYLVLPGFKLVVYSDPNYVSTNNSSYVTTAYDNTSGTQIKTFQITNLSGYSSTTDQGSSCKLYFKGTELSNVYDTTYHSGTAVT